MNELRQQVVNEARSWIPTPYHKPGYLKHVGVDCGMFPYMVCRKFGLIPELKDIPKLEDDWFANTSQERYARVVERYFHRLLEGQLRRESKPEYSPGNLVMLQTYGSRALNHAGIITCWPRVIHAAPDVGVTEIDAAADPFWQFKRIVVYDILSHVA